MSPPKASDPTSPSADNFTKLHNAHNAKVADLETCVVVSHLLMCRPQQGRADGRMIQRQAEQIEMLSKAGGQHAGYGQALTGSPARGAAHAHARAATEVG